MIYFNELELRNPELSDSIESITRLVLKRSKVTGGYWPYRHKTVGTLFNLTFRLTKAQAEALIDFYRTNTGAFTYVDYEGVTHNSVNFVQESLEYSVTGTSYDISVTIEVRA
jgi:hypothetical protein